MFHLAFKELVESAELEHAGGLLDEVGDIDGDDAVEHGVVVDGEFFVDIEEEVVGEVGVAECMVVDHRVLLPQTAPASIGGYLSSSSSSRIQRR